MIKEIKIPTTFEGSNLPDKVAMTENDFANMRSQIINVNKMLRKAKKCYCNAGDKVLNRHTSFTMAEVYATHKAYLIGIEPIVKETREEKLEKLLEEFVPLFQRMHDEKRNEGTSANMFVFLNKAKALLSSEDC